MSTGGISIVDREDWLVGGNRRSAATERIYAEATEIIAHRGLGALDIDQLAKRLHCSRATIYRHAGGKSQIRDAVMIRAAQRIVDSVRAAVDDLAGSRRIVTAIAVALGEIRADPLGQLMINSIGAREMSWLTESPLVADFAVDLNGLTEDDPHAAQWIIRVVLSLLYWPIGDSEEERTMVHRFVAPAFD